MKEPGTRLETRFHTDAAYFHVTGDQVCTIWVPLDAATPESGALHFVRGSHRGHVDYRPQPLRHGRAHPGDAWCRRARRARGPRARGAPHDV